MGQEENKKLTLFTVSGGLGKAWCFSALVPALKNKYGKIAVMSPYKEVFAGDSSLVGTWTYNEPGLFDRLPRDMAFMCREPYLSPYIFGKTHLCQEWAKLYGVEWTPEMKPRFHGTPLWEAEAVDIRQKKLPPQYIIVQFAGGQSPYNVNNTPFFRPNGQRRAYPLNMAQEFVNAFRKKYPEIGVVNYAMINEEYYHLQNCITLNTAWWHYPYLLRGALGFVGVDSSLHHMAAAVECPGVVIWGTTSNTMLGWEGQINLSNTSRHEGRPLNHSLGDTHHADGTPWIDRDILSTAVPVREIFAEIKAVMARAKNGQRSKLADKRKEKASYEKRQESDRDSAGTEIH